MAKPTHEQVRTRALGFRSGDVVTVEPETAALMGLDANWLYEVFDVRGRGAYAVAPISLVDGNKTLDYAQGTVLFFEDLVLVEPS